MWIRFEVVSARTIDFKKKYVVYSVKIINEAVGNEDHSVIVERRYSEFLELFNNLRKRFPMLDKKVVFPRRVFLGNFSTEVIRSRFIGFQDFLKVVAENEALIDNPDFIRFLVGKQRQTALKFLEAKKYHQAKPLLEKSFNLLNKIYTEHHPSVIVALCRLAACCCSDISFLDDASKYSDMALHRFERVSDIDLLTYYVPLIKMCAELWAAMGKKTETLDWKLNTLRRLGHRVDDCPSLKDSVLDIEDIA